VKTVSKYALPTVPVEFEIVGPKDLRVLGVRIKGELPYMYVLQDGTTELVIRKYRSVITEWPIQGKVGEWLGCFENNNVVLHYFENK
jgi:hypothetical protein